MTDIDRLITDRYDNLPLRVIKQTPFVTYIPHTYGLIVYCSDTKRWLMIQRRHSIGLLSCLRGSFSISNLPELFKTMTSTEVMMLETAITSRLKFASLLFQVYQEVDGRFIELTWKKINAGRMLLNKLIKRYRYTTNSLTWLWSKGFKRDRNCKEDGISAAMREFKEESGIKMIDCPYSISYESITYQQVGLMGTTYTTRCWIMVLANQLSLPNVTDDEIEVNDRSWMSTSEVMEVLDPDLYSVFNQAVDLANEIAVNQL